MREKLIYFVYRFFLAKASLLLVLYVLFRCARKPAYRRHFKERVGILPAPFDRTESGGIWFHAVSVGEVLSLLGLLKQLRLEHPDRPLYLSCGTTAGREVAEQKLTGLVDAIFYAPFDYVFAVRRVLRRLRPALLVICETEIWPNLWREARRSGAEVVVINGRISEKAMRRYRRLRWLMRMVLTHASAIHPQSEADAGRFRQLGAPADRVRLLGNLKYDFQPSGAAIAPAIQDLLDRTRPHPIWIAASTVAPERPGDVDEDDVVIGSFRHLSAIRGQLLLILAPRKPERFDTVAAKLSNSGLSFVRRSTLNSVGNLSLPGILLLDSLGELGTLFGLANVVFVGGTLADRGGHNILEPAVYGKPIVVGPHLENFQEIADEFNRFDAIRQIGGAVELSRAVAELLDHPGDLGDRARQVAQAQQGATRRVLDSLDHHYDLSVPRQLPWGISPLILQPLSQLWTWGGNWKRSRTRTVTLQTPVVSVGNITMGGVGKTPFVDWLTQQLPATPAILTRGYRRQESEPVTLLEAGSEASVERTGEEAQILLRRHRAHLGIGADRATVGKAAEDRFHPSLMILDDGFQHARLARQCDLVLIDTLDPFGGGFVFPRGRLREPLTALSRADAFVLTRTEPGRHYSGIRHILDSVAAGKPVFTSRIAPEAWVSEAGDMQAAEHWRGQKVAAFCGLGNPAAFWRSLRQLGCLVVLQQEFADHHHYQPAEIARLKKQAASLGAAAILTTEKDWLNLLQPEAGELTLYWLKVTVVVDQPQELLKLIDRCRAETRTLR